MTVGIYWKSFWAFVMVGLLGALLLADELMGITHVWGLNPITDDAEVGLHHGDPTLFLLILAIGPVFIAWWLVHIRNHRYRVRRSSKLSYQIVISGHHSDDNDTVQQVANDAVRRLRNAGHTGVSATGYSYNGPTRIDITTPPEDNGKAQEETPTGG